MEMRRLQHLKMSRATKAAATKGSSLDSGPRSACAMTLRQLFSDEGITVSSRLIVTGFAPHYRMAALCRCLVAVNKLSGSR
eukprot:6173902-Pleurochrysis_carterae.AAC.1